jgi:hypothetical protein
MVCCDADDLAYALTILLMASDVLGKVKPSMQLSILPPRVHANYSMLQQ